MLIEIDVLNAGAFGIQVHGHNVRYDVKKKCISCLNKTADLTPTDSRVKLRILVDRTSLEIFGDDGLLSMSFCFIPKTAESSLMFYAEDGQIKIVTLSINELESALPSL
jgi:fructan beta-fructosidase